MMTIPTPEEVGSAHYFLEKINTPEALLAVRCGLLLLAVGFLASYIYIRVKKDKEK